jgi:hypothetical protein
MTDLARTFASAVAMLAVAGAAAAQAPNRPPQRCDTAEYQAFDFWLGDWKVYPAGQSEPVAESRIDKIQSGCVVREWFMAGPVQSGTSYSYYDRISRQWRQTYVNSNGGSNIFAGGLQGEAMVLTAVRDYPGGAQVTTRMTLRRQPDGAVRQTGEISMDRGTTWSPGYDYIYRRP